MITPLSAIEISRENLIHNIQTLRSILPKTTKAVAVIKANAYGHGQNEVAQILEPYVDYFQVDDLQELELLRTVSQKPTLVFGYVADSEIERAVELGGILGMYNIEALERLNELAEKQKKAITVHIKVDALLGRQGILPAYAQQFCDRLHTLTHLNIEGLYAHFANIEDTADFSHAQKQIDAFEQVADIFRSSGFPEIITHISATSGVLAYEQHQGSPHQMVRFGLGLYGLWPSEELRDEYGDRLQLKPALRWVSRIAQIKELPAGHPIGYGLTYITDTPTRIAIVPQGYSDGYDRGLSNKSEVLIAGTRCKVLGRVMMNMLVVNIDHLPQVQREDEVVLLGTQKDEWISTEELAEIVDTIHYEIIARINPLLPRTVK